MSTIGNMKPRQFVRAFQKRAGLLIDGIPGPQTRMALWLIPEIHPMPELSEHLRPKADPPTPIDPADIRPGDVVRVTQEFEVESRGPSGTLHGCGGEEFRPMAASQLTWHLVSRPDPDAEAIEALERLTWHPLVEENSGAMEAGSAADPRRAPRAGLVRRAVGRVVSERQNAETLAASDLLAAAAIIAAEADERGMRHWTALADRLTTEAARLSAASLTDEEQP